MHRGSGSPGSVGVPTPGQPAAWLIVSPSSEVVSIGACGGDANARGTLPALTPGAAARPEVELTRACGGGILPTFALGAAVRLEQ